jgi:hypothetical protein
MRRAGQPPVESLNIFFLIATPGCAHFGFLVGNVPFTSLCPLHLPLSPLSDSGLPLVYYHLFKLHYFLFSRARSHSHVPLSCHVHLTDSYALHAVLPDQHEQEWRKDVPHHGLFYFRFWSFGQVISQMPSPSACLPDHPDLLTTVGGGCRRRHVADITRPAALHALSGARFSSFPLSSHSSFPDPFLPSPTLFLLFVFPLRGIPLGHASYLSYRTLSDQLGQS